MKSFFLALVIGSVLTPFWFSQNLVAQTNNSPEYELLAPIPLTNPSGPANETTKASDYIQGMVRLTIAIAGALAVLFIIIGGMKYMTTDAFSSKGEARETIQNAIVGFLLVISSFLILNTINPSLTTLNLDLKKYEAGQVNTTTLSTTTPGGGGPGTTGRGSTCANCITVPDGIPKKSVGYGCAAPGPCQLDGDLILKLQSLTNELRGRVTWEVTEMYPPTVNHLDSCHQNGTCADLALRAVTIDRLIIFLTALESTFGRSNYEYEACGSRLNQLRNDPRLARFRDKIKCESSTTGESAHVEVKSTGGTTRTF